LLAGGQPRKSFTAVTLRPAKAGSACCDSRANTDPLSAPTQPLLLLLLLSSSFIQHAMLTNACELTCRQDSLALQKRSLLSSAYGSHTAVTTRTLLLLLLVLVSLLPPACVSV
jgi:hypothetical protein